MQIKKRNRKSLIILGSLLILIGIILIGYKYLNVFMLQKEEKNKIEEFYKLEQEAIINNDEISENEVINIENTVSKKDNTYDYIAVLRIPKINLEKGLVNKNSKYNNIKYGIMIHNESDSPEDENGDVILLSHSGTSSVSHFRNLYKLDLDDYIYIDYNNKTYTYKVSNVYDIEKNGKASIRTSNKKSNLVLITCRRNTNKQIVVVADLQV